MEELLGKVGRFKNEGRSSVWRKSFDGKLSVSRWKLFNFWSKYRQEKREAYLELESSSISGKNR